MQVEVCMTNQNQIYEKVIRQFTTGNTLNERLVSVMFYEQNVIDHDNRIQIEIT